MPNAPARLCRCGQIRGTCGCAQRRDVRVSACKRGYDRTWRRWRENWIMEHAPVKCYDCGMLLDGNVRKIELHHRVKVSDDKSRRLDESNVIALCKQCHHQRTLRGE